MPLRDTNETVRSASNRPDDQLRLPDGHCAPHERAKLARYQEAVAHIVHDGARVIVFGDSTGQISARAARSAATVWHVNAKSSQVGPFVRKSAEWRERVRVIESHPRDFFPPGPVDVVVWVQRNAAVLCADQRAAVASFHQRYERAFGTPSPLYIPQAAVLSIEPVEHEFCFAASGTPIPHVASPAVVNDQTRKLGEPAIYAELRASARLPKRFCWEGVVAIDHDGRLNGIRFTTDNLLATMCPHDVLWPCQQFVLPVDAAERVESGGVVRLRFVYDTGMSLDALQRTVSVEILDVARRAA